MSGPADSDRDLDSDSEAVQLGYIMIELQVELQVEMPCGQSRQPVESLYYYTGVPVTTVTRLQVRLRLGLAHWNYTMARRVSAAGRGVAARRRARSP